MTANHSSNFIDLTGQRFGTWTALHVIRRPCGHHLWMCRCDCGTEKPVIGNSLRRGLSTSCGCRQPSPSFIDLTGQRFGLWTALHFSGKQGHYWFCRCDCGTERHVQGYLLRHNKTTNCGCLRRSPAPIVTQKTCPGCKQTKPAEEFSRCASRHDGLQSYCQVCHRSRFRHPKRARKAKAPSIPPFPTGIDRDAFGHWLSGFVDGEGCFAVQANRYRRAFFTLSLRADELPILQQIQSFLGCGRFHPHRRPPEKKNQNPAVTFAVRDVCSLMNSIVPHFERYPLRAKKAADFVVWKQMVQILYRVNQKPWCAGWHIGPGIRFRWTEEECTEFDHLILKLKATRRFKPESAPASSADDHSKPVP